MIHRAVAVVVIGLAGIAGASPAGGAATRLTAAVPDTQPCAAVGLLRRHHLHIHAVAARHGVPAVAIAGVVAAEWALNRNLVDTAQDAWLATRLAWHDESWWAAWAVEWERQTERVLAARSIANRWPVDVVGSGYVMSFGPAQIQPRTALRACARRGAALQVCSGGTRSLMQGLLDEGSSLELVGLVLRTEAATWQQHTATNVDADAGLLATLYSSGAEYILVAAADRVPYPNRMGRWVAARVGALQSLLAGGSSPDAVAAALCTAGGKGP